jgi:hypothetical protein
MRTNHLRHQNSEQLMAVTADQSKVLMEGFSALCFRLQAANLARYKRVPLDPCQRKTAFRSLRVRH